MNKDHLKQLISNLRVENTRSYLLNSTTNRKNSKKLDFSFLDEFESGVASNFINELLNLGQANLEIDIRDYYEDIKLREKAYWFFQQVAVQNKYKENEIKDFGINSQSFGFPLVSRTEKGQKGKVILAPLFIWQAQVSISSDQTKLNIKIDGTQGPMLNHALHTFQSTVGGNEPVFNDINGNIVEGQALNVQAFKKHIMDLQGRDLFFNPGNSDEFTFDSNGELSRIPQTKSEIKQIDKDIPVEYRFHNSAVLGLFKSTKEAIIKDLEHYLDGLNSIEFDSIEMQLDKISPFELDPSQLNTYSVIGSEKNLVIHGPPGTGKSTVLSGIISSALKCNRKVLFVCEKITALEVIKDKLAEKGLDNEVVLIKDIVSDKKQVLEQAKSLIDSNPFRHILNENTARSEYRRYQKKHNEHINALSFRYLFNWPFKKVCGRRIYLKRKGINTPNFSTGFLDKIESGGEHVLTILNELQTTFTSIPPQLSFYYVFGVREGLNIGDLDIRIEDIYGNLDQIYRAYIQIKEASVNEIDSHFKERLERAFHLKKEIAFHESVLKDSLSEVNLYFSDGEAKKILTKAFSKKYKRVEKSLNDLMEISRREEFNVEKSVLLLQQLQEKLDLRISLLNDDLEKLNSEIGQLELISDLRPSQYEELSRCILSWSDSYEDFGFNPSHMELSETSLEFLRYFKEVGENLNYCNNYNDFLELLGDLGLLDFQSDIQTLIGTTNWDEVIEYALLNRTLTKNEVQDNYLKLHTNDRVIERLSSRYEELVSNGVKSLKYEIQEARRSFIEKFVLDTNISLHQLFTSGRTSRNNLLTLFQDYRDLMVHLFPLILTTPKESSALFKGFYKYFDLVIFDEASQLTVEDSFGSLLKGKKVIISGDEHQMPPSKFFISETDFEEDEELDEKDYWDLQQLLNESLLKFGISQAGNFESKYLDFHYRSYHHKLIDFSNAAFYKRLIPIPQTFDYKPIDLIQVNGAFEGGCNEEEAQGVIKVLENLTDEFIEENSIGIATLNSSQQKRIWDLLDAKVEKDSDFRLRKSKLDNSGFFVKNLENLQGDERDLIILSVGYGPDRSRGFRRSFGMLNRITGHRLLNVLVTRARKRMVVLNSIPEKEFMGYSQLLAVKGNRGSAIFYAYLAYAKAVSDNNEELVASILSNLRVEAQENIYGEGAQLESPFEEEVYEMLLKEFSSDEITVQEQDSGFRIDMVLRPNSNPGLKVAIECDGAAYHSGYANHFADLHRQKLLENSGYQFVRIWGKSWYLNSEKEFAELILKIKGLMGSELTQTASPSYIRDFEFDFNTYREESFELDFLDEEPGGDFIEAILKKEDYQPIAISENKNSIGLGMQFEVQDLTNSGKTHSYTISSQTDLIKGKIGLNNGMVDAIRRNAIGDEFQIGDKRYKLLNLN